MDRMMAGWSAASREAAAFMMQKVRPPGGDDGQHGRVAPDGAVEAHHRLPGVMDRFIDCRAPPEMYDEPAMYDGSVIAERTKGELSARCDKEGANFLAINLVHEIATGRRSVAEARRMYAEQMMDIKGSPRAVHGAADVHAAAFRGTIPTFRPRERGGGGHMQQGTGRDGPSVSPLTRRAGERPCGG